MQIKMEGTYTICNSGHKRNLEISSLCPICKYKERPKSGYHTEKKVHTHIADNVWECGYCKFIGEVDPDPEDLHQREEAEDYIKAHFPIYF